MLCRGSRWYDANVRLAADEMKDHSACGTDGIDNIEIHTNVCFVISSKLI